VDACYLRDAHYQPSGIYRCFAPHGEGEVGLSSLIKTMSKEQKHTQQRAEALPNDFRVEKNQWQARTLRRVPVPVQIWQGRAQFRKAI
jgi:hypothetical protein